MDIVQPSFASSAEVITPQYSTLAWWSLREGRPLSTTRYKHKTLRPYGYTLHYHMITLGSVVVPTHIEMHPTKNINLFLVLRVNSVISFEIRDIFDI